MIIKSSFYYKYPTLGFLKQQIKNEDESKNLKVVPKIRLKPRYYFYQGQELIYIAILKKSKSLVRFIFEIVTPEGDHIANVCEKPIYKKEIVFQEYTIKIDNEIFTVQFKMANKSFRIQDSVNRKVVEGTLVTPFIRNLFHLQKYKVDIYESTFQESLWMAIVAGIFILD